VLPKIFDQLNMIKVAPELITLPVVNDKRGSLAFAEFGNHVPFVVKRHFYLFNLIPGVERGGHAHHVCHQFMVALNGGVSIRIKNLNSSVEWHLNSPLKALYVPPMNWVEIIPLMEGGILSVLASHHFEEVDYIRCWDVYKNQRKTPDIASVN